MDDQTQAPAEFPKMLYRGGSPYGEDGRTVHQRDTVVVKDADEEKDAKAGGFEAYDPPKPSKKEEKAQAAEELPRAVEATGSMGAAVEHLGRQSTPGTDPDALHAQDTAAVGGKHGADVAERTGTVDISKSEAPGAGGGTEAGDALETYHNQIEPYANAGQPNVQGGTPTPPGVASIVIDGKPDLPGVDGTREGKVQTNDLDRLDPTKHLAPDGVILPPGGDPAHQNAVKDHAPAGKTVDPGKPKGGATSGHKGRA